MSRPRRWPDGGCGAEIVDVFTVKGARQVLDAKFSAEGNIVVRDGVAMVVSVLVQPAEGEWRYVDHHATCPKWAALVERERAAKAAGS